jgi:predicted enzyme related to lactoylglutathione lyase
VTDHADRLGVVILHVADLDASLRFYRDALGIPLEPGLNEPADDRWIGGHHAEVSWRGGAYLHFALFASRPPDLRVTRGAELGFLVADADALHARIAAAGAKILHAPRAEPWGRTARYLDPDGNVVGITSR